MRAKLVGAALATLLATACQTAYQGNDTSPYYIVPAGSHVILNKELAFKPDQVSVYIQNGQLLRINEVQHYDPFCKFELYHRLDAARTVAPDDMTVTKASQQRMDGTFSQSAPSPYVRAATIGLVAQMGGEGQGGAPLYSYVTSMDLRSDNQPEIFRLTCARWAYPGMDEHISIAEIRRTLSPLFTLRLPAEG